LILLTSRPNAYYRTEKVYDLEGEEHSIRIYAPQTQQAILAIFTISLREIKKCGLTPILEDMFVNILEQYYKKHGIKTRNSGRALIEEKQDAFIIEQEVLQNKRKTEYFLDLVSKACENTDSKQLDAILKQAQDVLGSPLGKIYRSFSGSSINNAINPYQLLFNAVKADQREIIILLCEAGFDLNQKRRDISPFLHDESLTIFAAANNNYALVGLLAELGADLNKLNFLGFNPLISLAKSPQEAHYLSALGARDDKLLTKDSQEWDLYQAGKQFIAEYRSGLILALFSFIGIGGIQLIILGYLGNKLSIPMIEQPKQKSEEEKKDSYALLAKKSFLNQFILKQREQKREEKPSIAMIAERFDLWKKTSSAVLVDRIDLINWFHHFYDNDNAAKRIKNYTHYCELAKVVHEKYQYKTFPPLTEKDFNSAIEKFDTYAASWRKKA
jgi:hypothetical protein